MAMPWLHLHTVARERGLQLMTADRVGAKGVPHHVLRGADGEGVIEGLCDDCGQLAELTEIVVDGKRCRLCEWDADRFMRPDLSVDERGRDFKRLGIPTPWRL